MTPQAELTMLEAIYSNMLTSGLQRYEIDRRQGQYIDFKTLCLRIEQLRAQVQRASTGAFTVSQFRNGDR
ncbi:MAG: hypothetical protein ACP5I8_13290 [Phycisphaerae bacterium]